MTSKKIAQSDRLLEEKTKSVTDRTVGNVLSFSKKIKAKKLSEAKHRVYQATTNLNW